MLVSGPYFLQALIQKGVCVLEEIYDRYAGKCTITHIGVLHCLANLQRPQKMTEYLTDLNPAENSPICLQKEKKGTEKSSHLRLVTECVILCLFVTCNSKT